MNLSEHFTLEELILSQAALRKGIDNAPSAAVIANLKRLCNEALEPLRALLGVHLHVDSGYRSYVLNTLVGGAPHSAHVEGRAADLIPIGMDLNLAFGMLQMSEIPFDKVIIECNAWLHCAIAKEGEKPLRQAMTASGGPGHWVYNYVKEPNA